MTTPATGDPHARDHQGGHPPTDILSIDNYLKRPAPERPAFLVDGLVPREGRIMLIAPAKQGKSTLALQLAAALGSGHSFLGRESVKARTLYLQFDNVETVWREMLLRGVDTGLSYDNVFILDPQAVPNLNRFDIRDSGWQAWFAARVAATDPQLIVVDVFRKFHKADENKSDAMTEVSNILNQLTAGRCLLVLHHSVKFHEDADHDRPIASHAGRGSGVIAGDADGTWFLFRNRLDVSSRLDEDLSLHLRRNAEGFWVTTVEVDRGKADKFRAFVDSQVGVSHRQMAKAATETLGISRATFFRMLKQLYPETP